LIESFGIAEFLKSLPHGVAITLQNPREITDAAPFDFSRFDGRISTPIFFPKDSGKMSASDLRWMGYS
jgi:hypothetical protein